MLINNGPIGGKFNPLKNLLIKFEDDSDYSFLNLTGIDNKYKLYKEGTKWCLFVYSSCNINFLKVAKKIDIGLVGGGGGGGNAGTAVNDPTSAGGGGGAGGERITQYSLIFQPQICQLIVGGRVDSQIDGSSSSIIYNGNTTLEAHGGLSGNAPIPTTNSGYTFDGVWYPQLNYNNGGIGGNGGSSNGAVKTYEFSAYGGNGSSGANAQAKSGEDGQSLFQSSILTNQEDLIIVGGGGGGGYGMTYSGSALQGYGSPGNYGSGTSYGRGGRGVSTETAANTDIIKGNPGLIIIRGC